MQLWGMRRLLFLESSFSLGFAIHVQDFFTQSARREMGSHKYTSHAYTFKSPQNDSAEARTKYTIWLRQKAKSPRGGHGPTTSRLILWQNFTVSARICNVASKEVSSLKVLERNIQ